MIDFTKKDCYGFEDLVSLVALLRGEGGCEWDRAQTHESIRRNFLEETYEACEAIQENDWMHLKEELGDVLLQVVFHAGIETDAGHFTVDEVCDGICKKLIQRHPHLFTAQAQRQDWETLKRRQRGNQTVSNAMESVAKTLPSTWRADKIISKAEKTGFRWNDWGQSVAKLEEELLELTAALREGAEPAEEMGDVLFAAVNVAHCLQLDPEDTLNAACNKFTSRFSRMESAAARQGKALEELTQEELLVLWQLSKSCQEE